MPDIRTANLPLLEAAKWLGHERWLVVALVLMSIALALSEGIGVVLLVPVLDSSATAGVMTTVPGLRVIGHWLNGYPEPDRLLVVTALLAVAIALRGVLHLGAQYLTAIIPLRLHCAMMVRNYNALLNADLAYMPERNVGELQVMLYEYPQRASTVLGAMMSIIVSLTLISVFGLLMLLVSWQMTLAALAFITVAYFVMKALSRPWFTWAGKKIARVMADLNGSITETIRGLVLIKLRNAEPVVLRRFKDMVAQFNYAERRRHLFGELQSPVLNTASGLFVCLLIMMAMWIYGTADREWAGIFIFFILCLYRLMAPASRIVVAQGFFYSNLEAFGATEAFIADGARSRLPNGSKIFTRLHDRVCLDGVTLSYDAERGAALRGVDLELRRGEIVSLVGASGAGKTSIVTLLMRLRDPSEGRVLVDGVDLRDYEIRSWRTRVAAVSQDIVLFNDSVRNNLSFGLGKVSEQALWAALSDASADDFVRELPGGLDAPLGDAISNLSGGQRQRLSLARALVADPDVLILDEPTSQLDSVSEESIQRAIEACRGKRAVLLVAHRLSTVRSADRIYVLDHGRVVEQGTHAELHATRGQYRRLFDAQQRGAMYEMTT